MVGNRLRDRSCSSSLGDLLEDRAAICYICARVLGLPSAHYLVGDSASGSPKVFRLVDCWFSCPFGGPQSFFQLFRRLIKFLLLFGCKSLYLFTLAVGWSCSENSYARFLSCMSFWVWVVDSYIGVLCHLA